jgi:hypothetical protein
MPPRVAPLAFVALAVLVLSRTARAVPITGYAFGHVVEDLSDAFPNFIAPPHVHLRGAGDDPVHL